MDMKESMFQGHAGVNQECIVSLLLYGMALYFNTRESANK